MTRTQTIGAAIAVALILFLGVGSLVAHPLRKTEADAIALSYGGGPFEGKQFQKSVNPGSGLVFNGWFDNWYTYPVTQRDYIVSNAADGDRGVADVIGCADKNNVNQNVELAVAFKLNANKIRGFHERVGLKFHAWNGGEYQGGVGWDKLLNNTFRKPLEIAAREACRQFTTDELRSGEGVLTNMSSIVGKNLKESVNRFLGDEYFCGPNFQLGKEDCPEFELVVTSVTPVDYKTIDKSYNDQKVSENKITTARNDGEAKRVAADSEKVAKDALAPALTPEYLRYLEIQAMQKCATAEKCTLVITPSNTGVNINTGG